MKYRGRVKGINSFVFGFYTEDSGVPLIEYNIREGLTKSVEVEKSSISIFFGKKDKNGKEIYTNDKVKYKGKEYEVRYCEEYGAFGLYDEKYNRPLGRSGSSTRYEPYFMNDYHTRQMEVI